MFGTCLCPEADYTWDVYEGKLVKAAVPHTCCECRSTINPGERYERAKARAFSEGGWQRFATCVPCRNIWRSLSECDVIHGMLGEYFHEAYGFSYLEVPDAE